MKPELIKVLSKFLKKYIRLKYTTFSQETLPSVKISQSAILYSQTTFNKAILYSGFMDYPVTYSTSV